MRASELSNEQGSTRLEPHMRFITTTTPAGRLEYLAVMIALYVVNFFSVSVVLKFEVDPITQEFSYSTDNLAAFAFIIVGTLSLGLINVLRRMKDLALGSGWLVLHFVPLVQIFFHLMLLFSSGVKRSTYAPYGEDAHDPDSWVAKPTPGASSGPAVTFRGQALMLPGEEGWQSKDEAA